MSSNISRINEASGIRQLVLTFKTEGDDIELKSDVISDAEIVWKDDFRIRGFVSLTEMYDIFTAADIKPGGVFTWYQVDLYEEFFIREFVILSINEQKNNNNKSIEIEFQDNISWMLDNEFNSRGFTNKRSSDILKEWVNKIESNVVFNIENTVVLHKNFVIPGDESLLSFLEQEFDKEGFVFYQDKKSVNLKSAENLTPSKVPSVNEKYMEISTNPMYGFMIMDHTTKVNNLKDTSKTPNTKTMAYNPSTKSYNTNDVEVTELSEFIMNSLEDNEYTDADFEDYGAYGNQYKTTEYLTDKNAIKLLYMTYLKNTMIHIVVPGNIVINSKFVNMDVMFMGNPNNQEGINEGDKKLSGNYICTGIVDKITNGQKFIQKLIINRINYGK